MERESCCGGKNLAPFRPLSSTAIYIGGAGGRGRLLLPSPPPTRRGNQKFNVTAAATAVSRVHPHATSRRVFGVALSGRPVEAPSSSTV